MSETPTSTGPGDDFDPLQPETFDSAHEMYRTLRRECPVAYSTAYGGFWALTRYEDVAAAASDHETFISSVRAVVPSDPRGLRRPPLNYDRPAHTPFRRALNRTLQPATLDRIAPRLRRIAAAELQPLLDRGHGDISQEFGTRYPASVAAEWLNLPEGAADTLARVSNTWVQAWRSLDAETVNWTSEQLYTTARDLIADRKRAPRPPDQDPASSLLAERLDGMPLDEDGIVGAVRQALVVGMVAPPLVLGGIAAHLSSDRSLQQRLRTDPALMPAAFEEFIRLYSPYRGFARTVSREIERHGRRILPGEPVTLVYASANRDDAVFPDPDAFIPDRPNIAQHLGFGMGIHSCAGAPLARLSLRIALEELLTRTVDFEVVGSVELAGMPELGLRSVPMRFTHA